MDAWNTSFLLKHHIFRGYVSSREGRILKFVFIFWRRLAQILRNNALGSVGMVGPVVSTSPNSVCFSRVWWLPILFPTRLVGSKLWTPRKLPLWFLWSPNKRHPVLIRHESRGFRLCNEFHHQVSLFWASCTDPGILPRQAGPWM